MNDVIVTEAYRQMDRADAWFCHGIGVLVLGTVAALMWSPWILPLFALLAEWPLRLAKAGWRESRRCIRSLREDP